MSARIEQDADGMYRVIVNGKTLEGEPGRPLRFETRHDAEDMLERRADLFSMPARTLQAHH
ncbi:hypothetical protein [Streptacidiphilus fuscans]|uniref:Uncharacterized protein n=1 Tax=Streptacidiphilus fuscans TaxID=2789292 RepID=A0A931B8T5_9ACTN|nr:hypothetical protein [Streptacidiphilus fuscans]MBF9069908.1 hypothetical protein [Streptacidiphilus fuscans]